jgi:alanine-synthesizing transaminase
MFSSRTRWDRTENRLARLLAARRRSGSLVLDLTESNPTRAGMVPPPEILAPLATPEALRYAPDPRGSRAAREAVAADRQRHGHAADADQIVLTASTSEAYSMAFKLLCDPGDAILVPSPSYPLFDFLASLESVQVDRYSLRQDGGWHLDLASLEAAVTEKTRAVVVVNPNNPTGSYLKRDEAEGLLDLCATRRLAVLSDEVFADYAFAPDGGRVTSLDGGDRALVLAFGGLSKSCGLPQLKLGWMTVSGPPSLRDEALARLEIVADTYLSVGTPVQIAAPAILARSHELRAPIAARTARNLAALRSRIPAHSVARVLPPEGGWSAVLRIPATLSEEDRVSRLLERHGVLVHPGYFFDFETEAYVVLSLLTPEATFDRGLDILLSDLTTVTVL